MERVTPIAFVAGGLCSLVAVACSTPCAALEDHALDCGASTPRYVDELDSACVQTRRELGGEAFDEFASCVTSSTCEDGDAINRCGQDSFALETADPCVRYKLWIAACGLEPVIDPGEDCAGVGSGIAGVPFDQYVDCVTADGCPSPDDERWDTCQNVVPGDLTELLTACERVNQWSVRCEGQALSAFPVTIISIPECLTAAQPFTVSSHTTYSECIDALECDDIPSRLDCILWLDLIDDEVAETLCPELVAYADACGAFDLGVETVSACVATFGRFSPESFTTYVGCVTSRTCGDPAALQCAGVLELQ